MKKQIWKITAVCIFFFMLRLLSSCCEEIIRQELILTGFTLHNMDNSLKDPVELSPTQNEVNKNAYALRVKLLNEWGEYIYSSVFQQMNCLSSVVSATSCGEKYLYFYNEYPIEINIISDIDFNKQYPAASSLNDLFICLAGDSKEQRNYPAHSMSIEKLLSSFKGDIDNYYEYIDFYLKYPPENDGVYSFSVIITMSDNTIFTEQITVILK